MTTDCPNGLDPHYARKVCRNCGRRVMFVRASHSRKAHWQHASDMAGIAWKREHRRWYDA